LLREVEAADVPEGDVVQVEVPLELQRAAQELREVAPEDPAARDPPREPPQRAQRAKRRVLRIVHEVAPVARLVGPPPGKDRGNARRAVPENRPKATPLGRNGTRKCAIADDFPAAGI